MRQIILLLTICTTTLAGEREEVAAIARTYGLEAEVPLPDNSRVDLLHRTYAIEADWSDKWAEGIGQALYYAIATDRHPGVLLLRKADTSDEAFSAHVQRCKKVCVKHGIALWTANEGDPLSVQTVYPERPFGRVE